MGPLDDALDDWVASARREGVTAQSVVVALGLKIIDMELEEEHGPDE